MGDSLTKPPFGVTSAEAVINCLDICEFPRKYVFVGFIHPLDPSPGPFCSCVDWKKNENVRSTNVLSTYLVGGFSVWF